MTTNPILQVTDISPPVLIYKKETPYPHYCSITTILKQKRERKSKRRYS